MPEIAEKYFALAGLPPERYNEMLAWAFGDIDPNEPLDNLRRKWNTKHGDIFFCSKHDNAKMFLWSIAKAYLKFAYDPKKLITSEGGPKWN
jgi:hypothetical protein